MTTRVGLTALLVGVALIASAFPQFAKAQDQDDPPGRVARLGYMEGSVSFQPAGENDWVQAVPNRPMTTGDKLWADRDSRAEIQLGSSTIDVAPNTGFSFLNLDDRTVQMEITAGAINLRVWHLDRDTNVEIDTPNQAFTVMEPGRYRIETSENGDYTVVTIREGSGESSGNGQSYSLHAGQRTTFRGTTSLNADVEQVGPPDDFDSWSDQRDRRYQDSPSARYCSQQVVGFEDLDQNGDWQANPEYGNVWYPHVEPGWAPYHYGHWAWIDPWGWTWVDDAPWGYAPFHYGRWVNVYGRWGWVPGPREERPVYAPALVAFVGGRPGGGGDVAWFPLGPREVYVPAYRVSPTYVNQVNISNTTVNQTTVTNVYNTTIVNNNTTINNVRYVNRNVNGAVTAMPQHAFASAQPVARNAVQVNPRQFRDAPVVSRAAVRPAPQAVLGAHANTAGHVAAPPAAVANRQVIAKTAPPPPPPSFAARQQVLAQHPGQPIPRQELHKLAPVAAAGGAAAAAAAARVHVVAPTKPTTPPPAAANGNRPGAPGANNGGRPSQPQPGNERPGNQPAGNNRPGSGQPSPNQPAPNNRPGNAGANRPFEPPARNDRPPSAEPNARPEPNQPHPNARPEPNNRPESNPPRSNERPAEPPARNERPNAQPENRPRSQAEPNRPEANRPEPRNQPAPQPRNEPAPRPQGPPPNERPQQHSAPPPQNRPAPPPARGEPKKPEQDKKPQ
ncbi:MAG TPA: DUF6600 domain-containing protein [Candidatus Sulfotelmatobacter sp.]|nr:DUF6600 domain-containing protein [Candidatus Sulfotelmatobacter sp.]